jgi:hypothetical protein
MLSSGINALNELDPKFAADAPESLRDTLSRRGERCGPSFRVIVIVGCLLGRRSKIDNALFLRYVDSRTTAGVGA